MDTAYEKSKNIFDSYNTPSQLFEKLGIKIQKVEYSFFAKEQAKEKTTKQEKTSYIENKGKQESQEQQEQTFKKIGALMKYLLDNDIPFRANNILQDNNQRYQLYFFQHDITILISDMVSNNCFRDATYAIK
ncbi:MAG: hypothetical protein WCP92_04185 [bacterium]